MKARNREINIFNMSLLDILCGALGAFCFMMLVLLPSYRSAPQEEAPKDMVDPKTYEEAMKQIEELKRYLSNCRDDRDYCENKVDQQEKEIGQLSMRNPVSVVATFTGPHDFDLYIEDDRHNNQGAATPRVDPAKKQWPTWNGDSRVDFPKGIASEVWTLRDTPEGSYRVYYKLFKKAADPEPTNVVGVIVLSQDKSVFLPQVTLTQEGQVLRVATIEAKDDGHATVTINAQQ